jgi:hypothetical protein
MCVMCCLCSTCVFLCPYVYDLVCVFVSASVSLSACVLSSTCVSMRVFIFFFPRICMCFVGIEIGYRSESKTQVVNFLVNMIKAMGMFLKVLCYDDMCHLDAFIHKRVRVNKYMKFLDGVGKY